METVSTRHGTNGSASTTRIVVGSDIMAAIDAMPVVKCGNHAATFTAEQDRALLRYWESGRDKRDIARAIGFCYNVCLTRHRELVALEHDPQRMG